jgi:uncharacterized protein YggE
LLKRITSGPQLTPGERVTSLVDWYNLSGLRFAIAKPGPLRDQARKRALSEAKRRAELYAAEAGVELGPVLRITEGGARGPLPRLRAMAATSAVGAMAPGETEIRMTVSVVYAIKDAK